MLRRKNKGRKIQTVDNGKGGLNLYLGRWGGFLEKLPLRKVLEATREVATVISSRRISGNCNSKCSGIELEVYLSLLLLRSSKKPRVVGAKQKNTVDNCLLFSIIIFYSLLV